MQDALQQCHRAPARNQCMVVCMDEASMEEKQEIEDFVDAKNVTNTMFYNIVHTFNAITCQSINS